MNSNKHKICFRFFRAILGSLLLAALFFPASELSASERGIVMEGPSVIQQGKGHLDVSVDSKEGRFQFGSSVFEDDQVISKFNAGYDVYDWLQLKVGALHMQRDTVNFSPFKERMSGFVYGMKFRGLDKQSSGLKSPFGDDPQFKDAASLEKGEYFFGFNLASFDGSELYQMNVLDLANVNNVYLVVSKKNLSGEGLLRLRFDVGASIGFIPRHTIHVNNNPVTFNASRMINLFALVEKPIVDRFSFLGEATAFRFTGDFNVVEEFTLWNAGFRYRLDKGQIDIYATDLTGSYTDPGVGIKTSFTF